jgi:hypothetical protein
MNIVFDKNWFAKHQQKLLWLLNTPIIRVWFRYVMRIRKDDCNVKINQITPNSFSYGAKKIGDKIEITTDFRTHDKFSKRLYYAFKPLWYLLHAFDWAMLDRVEALTKLSFGFDTLTVYSQANPASTAMNEQVYRVVTSETWATIIAGAGNGSQYVGAGGDWFCGFQSSSIVAQFGSNIRTIFLFDTSALTSSASISAAVISLYGESKLDDFATPSTPDINVYTSTPASNTVKADADYTQVGSTAQCDTAITFAGFSTTAYNDFTLNATGISNVSKTGISKFGARNVNHDVAASAPTAAGTIKTGRVSGYFANETGTTKDPKLVVTYTVVVGPANLKTYNTNVAANIKTIDTNLIANVKTLNTNV